MKKSYKELLKEAIMEYDTKAMDYKGPMTDAIISFKGEGELETHRKADDIASILERYYTREDAEKDIEDAENENEISTGEEPDDVEDTMDDLEKQVTEDFDAPTYEETKNKGNTKGKEEGGGEKAVKDNRNPEDRDETFDVDEVSEDLEMEDIVIEKLIRELEEKDEPNTPQAGIDPIDDDKEEEELTSESVVTEDVLDLLDEEFSSILEQEEEEEKEEEKEEDKKEEEEDEDLDVDKEIKESFYKDEIENAFRLLEQEIEGDEEEEEEDEEGAHRRTVDED